MLKESVIERQMCRRLEAMGCLTYKFVSPGNDGVPDRMIILPGGEVIFAELKTDVGVVSGIQTVQIERMRRQGAKVAVVRGATGVDDFCRDVRSIIRGDEQ